jgi:hypothetical protein
VARITGLNHHNWLILLFNVFHKARIELRGGNRDEEEVVWRKNQMDPKRDLDIIGEGE